MVWGSLSDYGPVFLMCSAFKDHVLVCLEFFVAWAGDGFSYVLCVVVFPKVLMPPVHPCVTTPSVCRLGVQNGCNPVKDGGVQSAMAYCPVIGLFAHSLIHLAS